MADFCVWTLTGVEVIEEAGEVASGGGTALSPHLHQLEGEALNQRNMHRCRVPVLALRCDPDTRSGYRTCGNTKCFLRSLTPVCIPVCKLKAQTIGCM